MVRRVAFSDMNQRGGYMNMSLIGVSAKTDPFALYVEYRRGPEDMEEWLIFFSI